MMSSFGYKRASEQDWQQAEQLLRQSKHILAITHVSPDGDAIGSLLGFTHAMRAIGKTVTPACQDKPQLKFAYLSGLNEIRTKVNGNFDLVVGIDSSDLKRLGSVYQNDLHGHLPILVFDHHITNSYYGNVNIVIGEVASAAEIILQLLQRLKIAISPEIASPLLTGLVSDTQAFRTSSTTADSMAAAMILMKAGAPLMEIINKAVVTQPFDNIRVLGEGIRNTKMEDGLAYATISRKLRQELGLKDDRGDGGLVSVLINTHEAKIAAVFTENPEGKIEVSMRSRPGYDVSQVALEFGGGGHAPAAGCTLPGPMRDVVNQVVPQLRRVIAEA